jgi:pimeloyl-ACP methyl ester carboxylesterase
MSDGASAFMVALGLEKIDVVGFSIGGCVAQALAMRHPEQVRRLVLVGTAPRGGEMADRHPDVGGVAGHSDSLGPSYQSSPPPSQPHLHLAPPYSSSRLSSIACQWSSSGAGVPQRGHATKTP